jgi:fructose-1,6-bisphosphatase I
MREQPELAAYLERWAQKDPSRHSVAATVLAIASACREISAMIAEGPLAGSMGAPTGRKSGIDSQKTIDVVAHDLIASALRNVPVSALLSEEEEEVVTLDPGSPLAVAIDPIDGSSNVDANIPLGTIFTILPATAGPKGDESFLQPGLYQLAAGFVVYGPYTSFVLTVGAGTQIFTLHPKTGQFLRTAASAMIPPLTAEFAINSSNYRHWEDCLRIYVDDLLRGREGPRNKDFNMRWTATPVADIYRILNRGGIFLYPGDLREGYGAGRLRLIYEANPLAFIIEQAGGAAWSNRQRIVEIKPSAIHQHIPFIAGSRAEVEYAVRLHHEPHGPGERSPLFGRRGLFRS